MLYDSCRTCITKWLVVMMNFGRQSNNAKLIFITTMKVVAYFLITIALIYFCFSEYRFQQMFGHWGEFYKTVIASIGIFLILFLIVFNVFGKRLRLGIIGSIFILGVICLLVIDFRFACC